jgi:hypothetical protein
MQIRIERNLSLDTLDNYYRLLGSALEVDATVDLQIPKILQNDFVGLVPAIYQFVITWIRYPYIGKLTIDVENPEQENWQQLLENEHLFPIFVLVWNQPGIYNINGQINIKNYLKEAIAEVREQMVKVRPLKGWKLLLTGIDHFPKKIGTIPGFETPNGFIDNETSSYRNLKAAIDGILNYSTDAKSIFNENDRVFVAIMHELVKNTYEWGKTDQNNVPVDPSIRGVLVKFYKKRRKTFLNEFNMHKGLYAYFSNTLHRENANQELYFLEISVFDSGIGFVEKFSGGNKAESDEIDIIKKCLVKHSTSAKGLQKDDKGLGLDRILKLLDKRGFLRIRTNHSCLYRNLITHPYQGTVDEKKLNLFDWNLELDTKYSTLPNAAGSVITILYPLALNNYL